MSGARFEYATTDDPALNYCLWEYSPAAPAEDKYRSINLLFQSFEEARIGPRAFVAECAGSGFRDGSCLG